MTALEELRASQDRDLRRVGIPMIVVLRDETTAGEAITGPAISPEGSALANRLDQLRADLAAGQRDGDMGLIASLLTAAAHTDFGDSVRGTDR